MKKKLSFLMALVAMFLCTNGAWAETLYFAFGGGAVSDALEGGANQTWTSNEHAGYSWAITGNTAKGISGANKVNAAPYYDGNLTTFKNSNGAQNTFYMPEGVKICNIKFIGYTNALESEGTCTLQEINGVDVTENNTIAVYKDDATMVNKVLGTPGVIDYDFPEPVSGSFTFTMGGKQGCFIIVIETVEQEAEDNDYTGAIVNADLSTTDAWNTEGTKGISDGMVKVGSGSIFDFSQTITLPAGCYKMTAQAAYRYSGAEQSEYEAILAGTQTHYAKLYAETADGKVEVNVQNRWEGASETDYVAGNGSATVNNLFVPNSSAAVKTWFDNGKYVNELVFNVYEDGQVKIGIAKTETPEVGDYVNIGAWTLIRLSDPIAEPIEPEVPVYTMVQNEADLVAGGKYLIMAEVNGGWVALSDLSGKIRVPSDTLTVSENFTVATTVATAIAEAPAKFEGVAYELTLEGDSGAWKFKDELNGAYLHWSSGNYLINDAEGSAWTIAFNQYAHNAVITHAVTTERVLQYNASSPRFCAYTSVQAPVYLFKAGEVTVAPVAPSNPSFNTIAELLAFEVGNMIDLNVNNAKITYLSGNNMSITDGTDTLAIYDYNIPADYVVGGFLSGKITATFGEYKGNKQLTVVDWSEVTFSEPPYFADGDYLIINTETGYYLGGGNDWGTHATLLGKPQFFTFAHQGNNAYTLDSHQSNGGDSHYLATGLYCDGAAANWTFAKNENGNYTINNGGNYLAGNGTNKVIVTVTDATLAAAEWTIISRAEAFAALDTATQDAPLDATIYINNPECKRNAGGWTVTSADGTGTPSNFAFGGGGNTANCAESYHSTNGFDMSQVLVGMKPGVYRLDGHAFYRDDNDQTGAFPYFYVNDQQSLFPKLTGSENSMAAAYASFLNGSYAIAPIYFTVAEGDEVKIGAHGDNTAFWNIWGELGLTYYGADASIAEVKASSVYAEYKAAIGKPMNAEVLATMEAAKAAYEADSSEDNLAAFTAAVSAATASVNAYAISKPAIDAMFALMQSTNVYTVEAYEAYKAKAEDFLVQYEAGTLTAAVDNPAAIHGWRASVDYDDLLLSAFGVKDYDTDLYINTWSGEGETDGTEFKVPFFEYWTGDDASLGATTKTATVTGLTPGQYYSVEAWVRTRAKNGVAAAEAAGITLNVGAGDTVDVTEGVVVGESQFAHAVYTAYGTADENGTLTINFNVAADNNVSWLSFKNLKYAEVPANNIFGKGYAEQISEGNHYVFYTDAEGGNHFLYAAGDNNWVVLDKPVTIAFSAGNITDGFAGVASFMNSNGYYMSNAANSDGSGAIKTEAVGGKNGLNKRTWESQVFYKNAAGKYAIRLTNATGTGWGANCFVNIDPATLAVASGQPSLGDALYLWEIADEDDSRFSTQVLLALIEQAEALEGAYNKDVKAALTAVVEKAKVATAAEVQAIKAELEEAIAAAKASIADYKAIATQLAIVKTVLAETAVGYAEFAPVAAEVETAYNEATATVEVLPVLKAAIATYLAANEVEGIVNGTFGDASGASVAGWTQVGGEMGKTGNHNKWTNVNDGFFEQWKNTLPDMDFYQEVSGLPAGTYTFAAYVVACQQNNPDSHEVTGVNLFANAAATPVHTINVDRNATNQAIGAELVLVTTTIAEGETLKVGLSVKGTDANWVVIDNAKLYCFDKPAIIEMLPVVGAKVGDVDIVEGVATVESISTIDVTFDRPVALAENAGWATLADSWGPTNLKAEVLAENANVVRFTVSDEFGGEFTEAGDYILNIPAGFIVDAENSDCGNAEITATITIEAAPAVPLTVTNVTVGEDVMADLSAIVATPADMIKVNFDGQFYFQGMPTIVDAEGNDASNYFQYLNGLDFDGSNSYIFMAQNWEGVAAPAGIYTITLPKASFMEMMQWKAPAEDIVLTVQIAAGKKVVYDLNVERVAGLGYAAEDYTIATSELAALLGVESLGEATIWGVNPDGSYVADAMAAYDGWRAVDGTFAGWSSETAAVCVKLFAEEAAYLISICTHGDNGNDPVAGTQSTAVWALVAGVDTVVINTNITFVEPTIINIADYEVVSTIKVEHNETAGVAFSGNTASFDAAAVAAALGVASLADAEQYILNVTTGNLVVNTTDGWRNSQGDATPWGGLDAGSVCVKNNDPASGSIDYIGCYDATYEAGDVYTAKWAFVHEGKAVIIEVVITFIPADGIDNMLNADAPITVYSVNGKAIQTTVGGVKNLEKGIYIVNGKKVYVK